MRRFTKWVRKLTVCPTYSGFAGVKPYFSKYPAISPILVSCFTWKGQRLPQ